MNEQRFDTLVKFLDDLGSEIGAELFLVGGFVRDRLIGRDSKDIDILARGLPEQELIDRLSRLGRAERTGATFGVIRFFPRDKSLPMLEIALPRKEMSTGDGHKDFVVEFDHTMPVEDDLLRRDFTVNAIAMSIPDLELIDPFAGRKDIENGFLVMTSSTSAQDDPLRILRGLRFSSQLGFQLAPKTLIQMSENSHLLSTVAAERVQEELLKLVTGNNVADALRTAQKIGALKTILPELDAGFGCVQNHYHDFDVFEHTVRVVQETPSDDPFVKLAALFHDIAKPVVKWVGEDGVPHFYEHPDHPHSGHHELVGADMTREIMKRLKFSNDNTEFVCMLVSEHMFTQNPKHGRRAARRFLARIGRKPGDVRRNINALFDLREGDCRGGKIGRETEVAVKINRDFQTVMLRELENDVAFTVKDLAVNGHDLMVLGLKGQQIGDTQKRLLDLVVENPELNNRESLLAECMSLT